jgi:hypothetical protein
VLWKWLNAERIPTKAGIIRNHQRPIRRGRIQLYLPSIPDGLSHCS